MFLFRKLLKNTLTAHHVFRNIQCEKRNNAGESGKSSLRMWSYITVFLFADGHVGLCIKREILMLDVWECKLMHLNGKTQLELLVPIY